MLVATDNLTISNGSVPSAGGGIFNDGIDNPFTRELQSDPRFGAFCKKVGFASPPP